MSLDHSSLLIAGVTQTVENKTKEQRVGFFGMLLGITDASLLGIILAAKKIRKGKVG